MMTHDFETMLDTILADPLARSQGRDDAIGLVGWDIPDELIVAIEAHQLGRPVLHLPRYTMVGSNVDTPVANQWLESSFAPWTKSIVENWAKGMFDHLSHVIFSRGCDNAQRLYYYVCELQNRECLNGPIPLILDLAKIDRPTSLDRTALSLSQMFLKFGINDQQVRSAIKTVNQRRTLYQKLENDRGGDGLLYEKIARASRLQSLDEVVQELEPPRASPKRVLLAGSTPSQGSFHSLVHASGVWDIVGEFNEQSLDYRGVEIKNIANPHLALAAQIYNSPLGPRSFQNRAKALIHKAKQCRADAVILWNAQYDEALAWDIPNQGLALTRANIPYLVLNGIENDPKFIDDVLSFLAKEE